MPWSSLYAQGTFANPFLPLQSESGWVTIINGTTTDYSLSLTFRAALGGTLNVPCAASTTRSIPADLVSSLTLSGADANVRWVLSPAPLSGAVQDGTRTQKVTVSGPVQTMEGQGVTAGVFTASAGGLATITWVVDSAAGTTLSDGTQTHAIGAASAPASTWQTVTVAVTSGTTYTIAGTGLYVSTVVIQT